MKTLFSKQILHEHVLFLDGLSRAGKFLLGKVVSNFKRVDYFQYSEILEHIPIVDHLQLIDHAAAVSLFQIQLDLHFYNRAIGRNLNLRKGDGSCVANATEFEEIEQRRYHPDGIEAVEKLKKRNILPSFLVHECLAHVEFFLEAYPKMLMINIQRHPVDIAHSWYVRGWGGRYGTDPLAFIPVVGSNKATPVPWFAHNFQEQYLGMNQKERVIESICTLMSIEQDAYGYLSKESKKQVLMIPYEVFVERPDQILAEFSLFLNDFPMGNMIDVLHRERVFRKLNLAERKKKNDELTSNDVRPEIRSRLQRYTCTYEKRWELPSFN